MIEMEDTLALIEAVGRQEQDAQKLEVKFQRLTRKVFTTAAGRDWLRIALSRCNFMGSVFDAEDGMNAANAAYRDGIRSVFSDILNSAAGAAPPRTPAEDD